MWGSGQSASADGKKWDLYEQNLLSEYHIRYGGYSGIGTAIRLNQAGIDDYLHKPVSPSLLLAKVKVWLKRSASISIDVLNPIRVGTLQLFPSEKTILWEKGAVRLTNLELRLLYYLMNRSGQIVTIGELNQRVWGYSTEADNTMLKNVVYRLRRKIEADPANPLIIQTVPGLGYRLAAE